ncbi:MAG: polar amino acid transport system ATP-binding protein [Solirubrobacteraceae bacterium]|jgi:ABC-type histidine transport system ATPase subunit|nr:polar amino acid transport system ATP-binding protein [Solirubrobacteraceae bacterium]
MRFGIPRPAARLSVDGELVGYRQSGDRLYELREAEVARKRSEIGMVFQRFNLFSHLSALENVVEAPIRVKKVAKASSSSRGSRARCSTAPATSARGRSSPRSSDRDTSRSYSYTT